MIDDRIDKIKNEFKSFNDWEARYKHIIEIGKQLAPMSEIDKSEANKIKGCQSQVWLSAKLVGDKIFFEADSDASIVKGVIGLLVYVYSESTPDEVLSSFIEILILWRWVCVGGRDRDMGDFFVGKSVGVRNKVIAD